jgi:hypothetical protein
VGLAAGFQPLYDFMVLVKAASIFVLYLVSITYSKANVSVVFLIFIVCVITFFVIILGLYSLRENNSCLQNRQELLAWSRSHCLMH